MSASISASLMCARLDRLADEVEALQGAGTDSLHIDVMDGHFVPNLALSADIVRAIRPATTLPLHVHLMVERPSDYVETMASAGADVFLFHIEAAPYPRRLGRQVRSHGMEPGLVLNPATPVAAIESVDDRPFVQVMSVEPGFAGQEWVPGSAARVRAVRELCGPSTSIIVDGHIDHTTAPLLASAGANVFVCGTSSLFRGEHDMSNYRQSIHVMRDRIAEASVGRTA